MKKLATLVTILTLTVASIAQIKRKPQSAGSSGSVTFQVIYGGDEEFATLTIEATSNPEPAGATVAIPLTISAKLLIGPESQRLIFNPYSVDLSGDANSGGAPMLLEPTFHYNSGTDYHAVGMFIRPVFGTTNSTAIHYTAYNLKLGNATTPVPEGTKGQLSGYEANLNTAQEQADLATNESSHAFGATVVASGGAPVSILDGVLTINTEPIDIQSGARGINIALINNVSGTIAYGMFAQSAGTHKATAAYAASGNWDYLMDFREAVGVSGGVRVRQGTAFLSRNNADTIDIPLVFLNTSDQVEVGTNLVNNTPNPFLQLGSTSTGFVFQRVDSSDMLRILKQGNGDVIKLSGGNPSDGLTVMELRMTKGGVTSTFPVEICATNTAGSGKRALCVAN